MTQQGLHHIGVDTLLRIQAVAAVWRIMCGRVRNPQRLPVRSMICLAFESV
ncbi:hypothetical protein [Streptomyces sp. NBC_00893]|uniref:hypothetical protein n=1 Tax=Streptomyces sp. NBC_00893 TaxID=2975862 RepID=UPI0022512F9E|nr:hypothetical protein [Streptomyces sp. NBC_00893]MCX4851648.1 hypothetical protein [Streptomyces sp. NBC_00893]